LKVHSSKRAERKEGMTVVSKNGRNGSEELSHPKAALYYQKYGRCEKKISLTDGFRYIDVNMDHYLGYFYHLFSHVSDFFLDLLAPF